MKVAVIGAGWAGLAAAVHLRRAGCQVQVFEAAAQAGGRARPVTHPGLGLTTDNGQHILLGAYRDTLALMRSLGVDPDEACLIQPLKLQSADGSLRLGFWPLPAPAHRLGALFGSRGLSGWPGRRHLERVLRSLDPEPIDATQTAADWLRQLGCPPLLLERLWGPLCLAATNTSLDQADARLLACILQDSLAAGAAASRTIIPRGQLHDLWPKQACQLLGKDLRRQRVRAITPAPAGGWHVDDEPCDQVILAIPQPEAWRLLASLPDAVPYLAAWPTLRHAAIGTVSLRLSRPWESGQAMTLLWDDPAHHAWGQWLFDHSAISTDPADRCLLHIVIGAADRYAGQGTDRIIAGTIAQIRAQAPRPLPPIEAQILITEKRATFDVTPNLRRPGPATPWPGLLLAGDWTDTGYPAVLEGAVRSGLKAAKQALIAPAPDQR
ncbi:hydroxysqualene dehydroxylase HpnE [Castellaniella sp.]|uniref:hydroxysqualene dehydroxylase HpnE n=1 Tax=Castellaniella sp. TaxID=1955812 RepID=UPI002AFDFC0C|nr:hydroxysqualene dehydroxylase HpnE [Castellaniella sp.]